MQASHPGDEASLEIRDAQAALWRDGTAVRGPDSDAIKGDLRERSGLAGEKANLASGRTHVSATKHKVTDSQAIAEQLAYSNSRRHPNADSPLAQPLTLP